MIRQKIIILVINYGTPELIQELTKNFVASLPRLPKMRVDWVIGEAEDKDEFDSEELTEWQIAQRKVYKDKKGNHFHFYKISNRGFASNVNNTLKLFQEDHTPHQIIEKDDLILLLNPDTSLYWANLEKAINFMNEEQGIAIAGLALTNPNGQREKWGHSTKYPSMKLFFGHKRFSEPSASDEPVKVAWVSGGAMLIKYAWWKKVGGLDPKFYFYFEDVDFCRRINDSGGNVYFLPQATVNHLRGGSKISVYRRKKHFYAAEARYFFLYHSPTEYLLLRLVRFPYKIFYFLRCYLSPFFWKERISHARQVVDCEKNNGYPLFCKFRSSIVDVPYLKELWLSVIIANFIVLGEAIWIKFNLSSPLILHYNAYMGIDLYGDTNSFMMFPLLAFLVSLFNFILGIILFFSKRYTPFVVLPAGASLAFQITLAIVVLNLLSVNN